MLRLLLALLLATAHAAPPPRASDVSRIDGFHRLYVTPDTFADGLIPAEPAPRPEPGATGVVVLSLDAQALDAAGYTPRSLADHLRELDGMREVRLSDDDGAIWIHQVQPSDLSGLTIPHHQGPPVVLGDLGALHPMPRIGPRMPTPRVPPGQVPQPQAVPSPPPGHDLVIVNALNARATVKVGEVEVGQLNPRAQGTIRDVRAGTYPVTLVGPDGYAQTRQVETQPRQAGSQPPTDRRKPARPVRHR